MEVLRKQLKILEDGQSEIKRSQDSTNMQLGKLDDDVRLISQALGGNHLFGIGIVDRVKELEAFKARTQTLISKIIGAGTILGILWTLLLKFWDKIFP